MYSDTILGIAFFTSVVLCVYFYLKTRHTERMLLIEKGLMHEEFKTGNFNFFSLLFKIGFVVIGIGLGLMVATILHALTILEQDPLFFSSVFVFGGLGLVTSYLFERKKKKSEE